MIESLGFPARIPAAIPLGTPITRPTSKAPSERESVTGSREESISETGAEFCHDSPKSPVTAPPSQSRYCTMTGRSTPISARYAA